ncbi:MAG: sigma-70 family RNA polymerase sigma factor [Chloroflexi bacterium]|nr:sigma-70 family RNA polymerase sigma factor [Chloroflexota bacterium]
MEEALLTRPESAGVEDEQVLVDAAIGGYVQAFAALYDRHIDRVYRYVYYRVGNQSDAEDLTQQTFLQAWQAIGRYRRTGASFIAWLLTIAHNLVMSFFRRAKETHYLELEPVDWRRWTDPEGETFARYDRLIVRRAILRLKPEQQAVITLRFIEHFDYAEIAAALGKSEGNIRVIQHRALASLRRLLDKEVNL